MSIYENIGIILIFVVSFYAIKINISGYKYDSLMRRENSDYKGNHSIIYGSIRIPFPISSQSQNPNIQKIIEKHNRHVKLYWLSMIFIIPYLLWAFL